MFGRLCTDKLLFGWMEVVDVYIARHYYPDATAYPVPRLWLAESDAILGRQKA
jgi:hypothetical protein